MQVSIIIINFNCGQYIFNCIESIYSFTTENDFEIIIVDNNSDDGSVSELIKKFPEIKIINNSQNIGFGAANNTGARKAAGEYVFFLNPDTVFLNDCVSIFMRFFSESGNDAVSCGARLETASGNYSVSYGNFPSVFQQFSDIGFRVLYKKSYDKFLSISPPCNFDTPQKVGYLSGAGIFIKKNIFQKAGGFDERFFMYYEDTDLFFRLNKAGYQSFIVPEARIVHFGCSAILPDGSFNYAKYALMEKSKYLYFAKNIGTWSVFWAKLFQMLSLAVHYFGRYRCSLRKMWGITLKA